MSIRLDVNTEVNNRQEAQPREADFRQRIESRFQLTFVEAYRKISQEADGPHVNVDIFFSPHGTLADLEGLERRFKEYDPDIYIPEGIGWSQKDLDQLRQSASGKKDGTQLRLGDRSVVFKRIAEIARGSKKAITFIDVPHGHIGKKFNEVWNFNLPLKGNFSEALGYTRSLLSNLALHINNREEYMLDQINSEKVKELFEVYPSLRNVETIRILLSLGRAHAPMPSDYSSHSFTNEGIIRNKFGKPVNDELAAKIFLEYFIDKYLSRPYSSFPSYWLTNDSKKLDRFKRRFVGQMNMQDAERIFNYIKSDVEKNGVPLLPVNELESLFRDKNLQIPEPKNLDEYLNKSILPQLKSA